MAKSNTSNAVRRIVVRLLVLLATCVTTLTYTLTKNLWVLLVPPIAAVLLIVVYRRWRVPVSAQEESRRKRERKGLFIQLSVMLVILAGLFVYYILQGKAQSALGYSVLIAELGILIVLTVIQYVLEIRSDFDQPRWEDRSPGEWREPGIVEPPPTLHHGEHDRGDSRCR